MHKNCPYCGQLFEIEPGFFIGAMYVSYAFTVFILILVGIFMFLVFKDPPVLLFAGISIPAILILHPVIFRYSRVVYLHLFGGIRYQPDDDK